MEKTIFNLKTAALAVALGLGLSSSPALAADGQSGQLRITKDCSAYSGSPGQYCTIETSNLDAIPAGSRVYYDQALGVPAGLLDSNVVLDAGNGNRALGRCTLDLSNGSGLCTFSDGTGTLSGFTARVTVSYLGGTLWGWDGAYRFHPPEL